MFLSTVLKTHSILLYYFICQKAGWRYFYFENYVNGNVPINLYLKFGKENSTLLGNIFLFHIYYIPNLLPFNGSIYNIMYDTFCAQYDLSNPSFYRINWVLLIPTQRF